MERFQRNQGPRNNFYGRKHSIDTRNRWSLKRRKRPYEALYNKFKVIAIRSKHSISLTYEEFVEFTIQKVCGYCGDPVFWAECNLRLYGEAYNLDRKDSSLGYTKENCFVCCKECNRGKSDIYTHEEWKVMAKALAEFRRGHV